MGTLYAKSADRTPSAGRAILHNPHVIHARSAGNQAHAGRARLRPASTAEIPLLRAVLSRLPLPNVSLAELEGDTDEKQSFERTWVDRLDDQGSASLQLLASSGALALMVGDGDDLVTLYYKAVPAATMFVKQWPTSTVYSDQGEAAEVWQFGGPLVLGLLARGLVWPSRGLRAQPIEEDRPFNWTSPLFDDSSWGPPGVICQLVYLLNDPTNPASASVWGYPTAALGAYPWDPAQKDQLDAYALWAPGAGFTDAAAGTVYFRQRWIITGDIAGPMTLYGMADNEANFYVDGQLVLNVKGFNPQGRVDLTLSAGEHTLAVEAINYAGPSPGNPAGVYWSLQDQQVPPNPIRRSDAGTVCLAYPPAPPGMSVGQIMLIALREAQARGQLGWLTPMFDETHDSDGQPWAIVADVSTKVGNDLLTFFVSELAQNYVDVWVAPADPDGDTTDGLKFFAWAKGTRGATRTAELVTGDGDDGSVQTVTKAGEAPVARRMLVKSPSGWDAWGDGDGEALLTLGSQSSPAEVERQALAALAQFSAIREQISTVHQPLDGHDPYIDYGVGDTITLPATGGFQPTTGARRITAITVTEHGDDVTVQTDDPLLPTFEERVDAIGKKWNNGSLGGRARNAQPLAIPAIRSQGEPSVSTGGAGLLFMLTSAHILGYPDDDTFDPTVSPGTPDAGTTLSWASDRHFVVYAQQLGLVADPSEVVVTLLASGVAYGNGPHSTPPIVLAGSTPNRLIVAAVGVIVTPDTDASTGQLNEAIYHPDCGFALAERYSDSGPTSPFGMSLSVVLSDTGLDFDGTLAPFTMPQFVGPYPDFTPLPVIGYDWHIYAVDGADVYTTEGSVGAVITDSSLDAGAAINFLHILEVGTEAPLFLQPTWRRQIAQTAG